MSILCTRLLHCGVIVFHWKQFQHSSRFKHFLRTFPNVAEKYQAIFGEKKRVVNHFTLQTTKSHKWKCKSIHIIKHVLVCNELSGTKLTKDKSHNCIHPLQNPLKGIVHLKMII